MAAPYRVPGNAVRHVQATALSATGDVVYSGGSANEASRRAIQFNNEADDAGVAIPSPGIMVSRVRAGSLKEYHVVVRAGTMAKVAQAAARQGGGAAGGTLGGQVAANALQKQQQYNQGLDTGATDVRGAGVAVAGEFKGVHMYALDVKAPGDTAVDAQNVDGVRKGGGLGPRPGLVAMYPRRNQSLNSTAAVPAAYSGRFIEALSAESEQGGLPTFIIGYDKSNNYASLASTLIVMSRYGQPHWHPQWPIKSAKPVLNVKTNSAGVVSLSVIMPARFRKALPVCAGVNELVVRRSSITYPVDIDGESDLNDDSALKDRVSWDGTSTLCGFSASTGTVQYITAWGVSHEEMSAPAHYRLTVG